MSRTWTTKNGEEILISEMTTGHLINTISMLERGAERFNKTREEIGASPILVSEIWPPYDHLVAELEKRAREGQPEAHDGAIRFSLLELD